MNRKSSPAIGVVLSEEYKSRLDGLAFGPKDSISHIKLYTVRKGDTFPLIARKTLGSSVKGKMLAELNGLPVNTQFIPGVRIKTIY